MQKKQRCFNICLFLFCVFFVLLYSEFNHWAAHVHIHTSTYASIHPMCLHFFSWHHSLLSSDVETSEQRRSKMYENRNKFFIYRRWHGFLHRSISKSSVFTENTYVQMYKCTKNNAVNMSEMNSSGENILYSDILSYILAPYMWQRCLTGLLSNSNCKHVSAYDIISPLTVLVWLLFPTVEGDTGVLTKISDSVPFRKLRIVCVCLHFWFLLKIVGQSHFLPLASAHGSTSTLWNTSSRQSSHWFRHHNMFLTRLSAEFHFKIMNEQKINPVCFTKTSFCQHFSPNLHHTYDIFKDFFWWEQTGNI